MPACHGCIPEKRYSPRWWRHPKDENVSLRAKRSNLFDRDCFGACAPRNDTPSSLMRCHCCSLDRLPLFGNAPLVIARSASGCERSAAKQSVPGRLLRFPPRCARGLRQNRNDKGSPVECCHYQISQSPIETPFPRTDWILPQCSSGKTLYPKVFVVKIIHLSKLTVQITF